MDLGRGVLVRCAIWVGDDEGHCVGKKGIMIGRGCGLFDFNSMTSLTPSIGR